MSKNSQTIQLLESPKEGSTMLVMSHKKNLIPKTPYAYFECTLGDGEDEEGKSYIFINRVVQVCI